MRHTNRKHARKWLHTHCCCCPHNSFQLPWFSQPSWYTSRVYASAHQYKTCEVLTSHPFVFTEELPTTLVFPTILVYITCLCVGTSILNMQRYWLCTLQCSHYSFQLPQSSFITWYQWSWWLLNPQSVLFIFLFEWYHTKMSWKSNIQLYHVIVIYV